MGGSLDVPDSARGGGEGGREGLTLRLEDRDSQRLASETHRLLQCHHEHAMTVSELVQSFKEAEDPISPGPEVLNLCLHKHNVKKGGSKSPSIFQVMDVCIYCYISIQSSSRCVVYKHVHVYYPIVTEYIHVFSVWLMFALHVCLLSCVYVVLVCYAHVHVRVQWVTG